MAPIEFDRRKQKTKDLENVLAPLEIAKILNEGDQEQLPFAIRPLFASGETPVGYVREAWSGDVNYYTANRGARRLIVAFCCGGNGLGVPTAYFLQMLRDDLYDVLVLYDRRRLHYDRGIPGFSDSFLETMRCIEAFVKGNGFDEVITFGTSVGGYPALRAGLFLRASRAISVGGVYCWHVARLLKNKATMRAFDLLCPCFSERPVELVAVTPARNQNDVRDLETLRQTFPKAHAVMIDTERHNVMGYLHSVRLLRLFCACLLEYWDNDFRNELLALLDRTARYSNNVEAAQADRITKLRNEIDAHRRRQQADELQCRQELKSIYASRSWRLTKPLRRLAEMVRGLKQTTL